MRGFIYLVLASIMLAGCGGEEFQDLRDFVKNAGADLRGKIPPPPEVKPYEPFAYNNKVGYAVIRAPDGKLHRVKAGNYVGLNLGLILEVTDTEVRIKEMVQDSSGDWSERMSSLQLIE